MTDEYLGELADMAGSLASIVSKPTLIGEALELAARDYGTTTGRMKYALSFARKRGMVCIDYDTGTVVARPASEKGGAA